MCDVSFLVEAVVRGYHKYKDIWVAIKLLCRREPTNQEDRFAVAVVKDSNVVATYPGESHPFVHCS